MVYLHHALIKRKNCIPCRGSYESERTTHSKGDMRQDGREWEGQNSGEQRHWEIRGRERHGVGNTGYTRWTLQGISGRNAGNLKEVGLGWINGGRKDRGFGWGMIRGGGEQLF